MQVQLKPWGNSQAIRFSREFLSSAGMKPDEVLTAEIVEGKIILSKRARYLSLQQRAQRYGGELHLSDELPWGEPQGNEVW